MVHTSAVRSSRYEALGKFEEHELELLLATPQATLMHLSCSPNFPPASYLDETYEPIVNCVVKWNTKSPEATIQLFKKNLKCRSLNQRKMKMTCKIAVKDGDHV